MLAPASIRPVVIVLLVFGFGIAACGDSTTGSENAAESASTSEPVADPTSSTVSTTTPPSTSSSNSPSTPAEPVVDPFLIDWHGIGAVRVGSSIELIANTLGPAYTIGDHAPIDDFYLGYPISSDGEELFIAGGFEPDGPMSQLIVSNPKYALESGLRVGMSIAEAVALHGDARLWTHELDEGEFVEFADSTGLEGETIKIQTEGDVGTYGPGVDGALETTEYRQDGVIAAIWVVCFGPGRQGCAPDIG